MALLGIIENQINKTASILKQDNCEIIDITKKEQLETVNGVVIILNEKEDLSMGIEWLLACREYPGLFVWFFSYENLETELRIIKDLGANGVFLGKQNIAYLNLVIENVMLSIRQIEQIQNSQESEDIINFKNQTILVKGTEKELTKKEMKLFGILYDNRGSCITYTDLLNELWPKRKNSKLYQLTNTIFHLRQKIKESNTIQIKTIRSKGYLLTIKKKEHEE